MKKVILLLLTCLVLFSVAAEKQDWSVGVSADYVQSIKEYWTTPGMSKADRFLYDVAISVYAKKDINDVFEVYGKLGSDVVGASFKFDRTRTPSLLSFFGKPFPYFAALGASYKVYELDNLPIKVGAEISLYDYESIESPTPDAWKYPTTIGRFYTASVSVSTDYDCSLFGYDFTVFFRALLGKRFYIETQPSDDVTKTIYGFTPTWTMGVLYNL